MRIAIIVLAFLAIGWGFWLLKAGRHVEMPPGAAATDAEEPTTEPPAGTGAEPAAPVPELSIAPAEEPADEQAAMPEAAPGTPAEEPQAMPAPEVAAAPEAAPQPEETAPATMRDPVLTADPLNPSDALAAIAPELARPAAPPVRTAPAEPEASAGTAETSPEPDAPEPTTAEAAEPAATDAPETPAAGSTPRRVSISADRLNLREGPGTDFPSLGLLDEGTRAEVLEEEGDWIRIRTEDGTEGWVSARFVAEEEG